MQSALRVFFLGMGLTLAVQAAPVITPGVSPAPGSSIPKPRFLGVLPPEVEADHQRAIAALKDGKPQRAITILAPWVKKYPDDITLASDYATALTRAGKFDDAREVLEEALMKNDETSAAFVNLREILAHQAAVSYAKALGRKPPSNQLSLRLSSEPPLVVAAAVPVEPVTSPPSASVSITVSPAAPTDPASVTGRGATASKAANTAVSSKPEASPAGGIEAQITRLTKRWAEVWSAKDFEGYVSLYSQAFETKNHASRQEWVDYRRPRVSRPGDILIELSDLRVRVLSDDRVEVRFRQRYEAPNLKVSSQRGLLWHREAGQWKILREEGR